MSPAVTLSVTVLPKVTVLVGTVGAVPNAPITRIVAERRDTVVPSLKALPIRARLYLFCLLHNRPRMAQLMIQPQQVMVPSMKSYYWLSVALFLLAA